jgi:hypothetical protein
MEVQMKVNFVVNGVREGHVSVDATVGDAKQRVLIDGLEVSLSTEDSGRSLTLPFHGSNIEEAKKIFQPGSKVCFTVEEGY